MAQQKSRIEEIDYLRGFAILAVITIHISDNFTHIPNVNLLLTINLIIDVFSHFAVPLFICISGFVLSLKYNSLLSKKSFYKKRAKSILPPYIIFSILYIILRIIISAINGDLRLPSIIKIIYYLLTASSSYHLWYFALIIQFYILYPYIIKKYEEFTENNRALYFIGISLIIQLTWIVTKTITEDYLSSVIYLKSITYFNPVVNNLLERIFLSHIFYFILGIYACKNYKDVKDRVLKVKQSSLSIIVLLIILVSTGVISTLFIIGIVEYGGYYKIPNSYIIVVGLAEGLIESLYFPLVFSILLLISLKFASIRNKYTDIILSVGQHSFGIYLIHVFFMQIIIEIIYPHLGIDYNQWIFYPVLFLLTLLLSYFSVVQYSSYLAVK
ncbi:acyltransferase [Methanosarcina sp.]|uniref:acyltransferase n=1 Tax=Methanosarcina sp. TaxID=2213 RepID=UPI003BB6F1EE